MEHPDRRRLSSGARGDADPLKLLLAEDDPGYNAYLTMLTKRVGFLVDAVADGAAVFEQLAKEPYDVAIIDIGLPSQDGLDVIKKIRADYGTHDLYTLTITGREDTHTKLLALHAGFDDFICKSASEAELVAKLGAARRVAARQRTLDSTARELYGLATRDELTSVCNRRFFVAETERLLAAGGMLSVILFDLDGFKQVNDTYGHIAGDHVLQHVATVFQRNTRSEDLIARYGGDEFVMVLADVGIEDAERIAQRLTEDVRALKWKSGTTEFSIGVTTGLASTDLLPEPSLEALLDVADRDLYKNKWLRTHPNGTYEVSRDDTLRIDLVMPLPTPHVEVDLSIPRKPRSPAAGTRVAPPAQLED